MTRFVKILQPDLRVDDQRLRLECDSDKHVYVLAEENCEPKQLNNPDARRVTALATIELDDDVSDWLRDALIELRGMPALTDQERVDLEIAVEDLRGRGRLVGAAVIDRLLGARR